MTSPVPPATRATRLAANGGLAAVILFGVVALLTTQDHEIRATLPSSDDPYDAVVSVAMILLPFLVAVTWIRSVRNRRADGIPAAARRRIHRGIGVCLGLVGAATTAQVVAIVRVGAPDAPLAVLGLIALTGGATIVAAGLLARAVRTPTTAPGETVSPDPEPDTIDDLVALTVDVGGELRRAVPAVGGLVASGGSVLDHLADASIGPRRHRLAWIALASVAIGVGGAAWHGIAEGAWASLAAAALYGSMLSLVVALGLGILGPYLRVLRPA